MTYRIEEYRIVDEHLNVEITVMLLSSVYGYLEVIICDSGSQSPITKF